MKRTKDGSFRVDPTPEIEVFVNVDADIAIEIDENPNH